jgi:hypothetical protein
MEAEALRQRLRASENLTPAFKAAAIHPDELLRIFQASQSLFYEENPVCANQCRAISGK